MIDNMMFPKHETIKELTGKKMKVRFVIEVDYSWTGCGDFYSPAIGSKVKLFDAPINVTGTLIQAERIIEEPSTPEVRSEFL